MCKDQLKDGGFWIDTVPINDPNYETENKLEFLETTHPCSTMCGAEWDVFLESEWEEAA
jgi:hypothetical protein